jgi:hypothetical protein
VTLLGHAVSPPPPDMLLMMLPPEQQERLLGPHQQMDRSLPPIMPAGRVVVNEFVQSTEAALRLGTSTASRLAQVQLATQWRASTRFRLLLQGSRTAKELALRVPVEEPNPGEAASGPQLFAKCFRWLSQAWSVDSPCADSITASLLRLLVEWVYECPPAATEVTPRRFSPCPPLTLPHLPPCLIFRRCWAHRRTCTCSISLPTPKTS